MTGPLQIGGGETESVQLGAETRLALADDITLLARLHDREPDATLIATLRSAPVDQWLALRLDGPEFNEIRRLMDLALAALPDPIDQQSIDELAAEFAAIYLTYSYRASPTESPWLDDEGLERQAAMFAVRRWYRRLGFQVEDWRRRSDDHLVYELQFLAAALRDLENPDALRLMAEFMREHPLTWTADFAARVASRCRLPFFAASVLLTAVYLKHLAALLGSLLHEAMSPRVRSANDRGKGATVPTCADPPQSYVPGIEPGW